MNKYRVLTPFGVVGRDTEATFGAVSVYRLTQHIESRCDMVESPNFGRRLTLLPGDLVCTWHKDERALGEPQFYGTLLGTWRTAQPKCSMPQVEALRLKFMDLCRQYQQLGDELKFVCELMHPLMSGQQQLTPEMCVTLSGKSATPVPITAAPPKTTTNLN